MRIKLGGFGLGFILVSGIIAGCGSSGAPDARPTTTSASNATAPSPEYSPIGTIAIDYAPGATLTIEYSLGSMINATSDGAIPPAAEDAYQACEQGLEGNTLVYVPGQVTVSFSGPNPTRVSIEPSNDDADLSGPDSSGLGFFDILVNGSWVCGGVGSQTETAVDALTLSGGQSVTMPFWIVASVLSSSYPTLTPDQVPGWAFVGALARLDSTYYKDPSTATFTGAHATSLCKDSSYLGASQDGGILFFPSTPYSGTIMASGYLPSNKVVVGSTFTCNGPGSGTLVPNPAGTPSG